MAQIFLLPLATLYLCKANTLKNPTKSVHHKARATMLQHH